MDNSNTTSHGPKQSWLDRPVFSSPIITVEKLIFALILIVAIFTRFYMLEARVMSHDETSHTYFSWLFYKTGTYDHDPITHGPLQFHLVALTYFLFGDSDTTARIPAALFSIASVAFMWCYRRYFGRVGALIAAIMLTISPYMLFYGRYVRNEAFVELFGIVMIWSMLRYIDTARFKYLYLFTAVTVLHFTAKETSFIYSAQALLFLAIYLVYRLSRREWKREDYRKFFYITLAVSLALLAVAVGIKILGGMASTADQALYTFLASISPNILKVLIVLGLIGLIGVIYLAISGFSLERIRQERSFDLLMVLGTLVLPQLSAFGISLFGWKVPVNAAEVIALTFPDLLRMAAIVVPIFIISIILGLWWNWRKWLINAGIWYAIYIVLFTSVFTNGAGFFTGLVGSLGYWIQQQAVNRGDQPWYYYALIQVPMYEYLPAIGAVIGIILAAMGRRTIPDPVLEAEDIQSLELDHSASLAEENEENELVLAQPEKQNPASTEPAPPKVIAPMLSLLIFWSISSLAAYSYAGEKMPWLTVHITLPMILLSGWAIGYLVDTTDWSILRNKKGWLFLGLLVIFSPALISVFRSWLGDNPPFAGKSLDQLAATSEFVIALLVAIASLIGLIFLLQGWPSRLIRRGFSLVVLLLLGILTARAAFMASYINYDTAKEYLVYAHCAPGDKIALQQITDISRRLTGGLDLTVAYDDRTTYPYWWYLRNFTNQRFFGSTPTRDLRDVDLILVGQENFGKIESVVGQAYDEFDYIRIWWPNMDYFNLTGPRMMYVLLNPDMREAVFQVWLNRDYTKYAELTGQDMSLQNWSPSEKFKLYIRKDVVSKLWDYGSTASVPVQADPYEGKQIALNADKVIGFTGTQPGQFQSPRDVALAPDGTLYVADTNNNRIQHLSPDGTVLQVWGSFADISKGAAPGGTFFEPWGIAVGSDGSVYVADTWNYRIQKFTSDGKFINMWGYFGRAETPFSLWGPRDIAIDSNDDLFVADTGNKRIVVYDPDGNFVTEFGSVGMEPGQFDEPVGVAVDKDGLVYIDDTWNQRIQVMQKDSTGKYIPKQSWEIVAWYGESLDNKPYLAVDDQGNLYTSDPEGYRVLHFTTKGVFINFFGDYGIGPNSFNLPTGIVADGKGGLWVADTGNGRIMHFTIPTQ